MATQKILRMPVKLDATGTTGNNAGAILEVNSTTQGFLPPRMTTSQKNLVTQVEGLVVYDTDLDSLCQSNGVSWSTLGFGVGTTTSSATPTINTDSII